MKFSTVVVVALICSAVLIGLFQAGSRGVKVGQVWVYDHGNPFSCVAYTNTVIEVREGWVQYKDQRGLTHASTISWFRIGSKLVSE